MARKRLRTAVIGAGNMGRNHVRTYRKLPDVDIVALADINLAAKKIAEEHNVRFYTDYQKMLDTEKPDAVSLVVPTPLHYKIGLDVIKRGIHILIEKPIASSVKEAKELIASAKQHDVVFTVGHIERYNPIIRKLKEMIDEKKLGKITSIVCKRVGGFPNIEPKTDVIIDLAVHDIDIINYLLGSRPKRIHQHGSRTHHSQKIDAAEILLDYGDASGFIQANWITPVKVRTIAVTGSKGYIEGNYITQELVYHEHNMQWVKNNFDEFVAKLGEPKKHNIEVIVEEPLAVELKSFLQNVEGKRSPLVNPDDAMYALKLALEAVSPYEAKP
jgi:UDP-N-acetylglucosamine 3-dehydrogenase